MCILDTVRMNIFIRTDFLLKGYYWKNFRCHMFCNSTITLKGINTKDTKEVITGKQNNVKTLLNNKI